VALLESAVVAALAFTVVMQADFALSPNDVSSCQSADEKTHHLVWHSELLLEVGICNYVALALAAAASSVSPLFFRAGTVIVGAAESASVAAGSADTIQLSLQWAWHQHQLGERAIEYLLLGQLER